MEEEQRPYDVIIIGGGPAGSSAAIYSARAGLKTLVIDRGPTSGALGSSHKIENYPGLDPMTGDEVLAKISSQAKGFGAEYIKDTVVGVTLKDETKSVFTNGGVYDTKAVIIASGSMGRKPTIKGEAELIGRGVSYCATCDAPFQKDNDVMVVGKPEQVLEELGSIARFAAKVYLISPNGKMDDEAIAMIKDLPNVEPMPGFRVSQIMGEGFISSVELNGPDALKKEVPVSGIFVYMQGNKPIVDFLQDQVETSSAGCIEVDAEMATNMPGVYAIGDVTCKRIRQVVLAASEGAIGALAAERYIRGKDKLRPQWS